MKNKKTSSNISRRSWQLINTRLPRMIHEHVKIVFFFDKSIPRKKLKSEPLTTALLDIFSYEGVTIRQPRTIEKISK